MDTCLGHCDPPGVNSQGAILLVDKNPSVPPHNYTQKNVSNCVAQLVFNQFPHESKARESFWQPRIGAWSVESLHAACRLALVWLQGQLLFKLRSQL